MLGWSNPGTSVNCWPGTAPGFGSVVVKLPFPIHSLPIISLLSMGHPPAGNRISGDILSSAPNAARISPTERTSGNHYLAALVVVVSPDVLVWRGQAAQWRPDLEKLHGFNLSLRISAAANASGMVCAALPPTISQMECWRGVWNRVVGAVFDPGAVCL